VVESFREHDLAVEPLLQTVQTSQHICERGVDAVPLVAVVLAHGAHV